MPEPIHVILPRRISTSNKLTALLSEEVMKAGPGRGLVVDASGHNETWVISMIIEVAMAYGIGRVDIVDLPVDEERKREVQRAASEGSIALTFDAGIAVDEPQSSGTIGARQAREAGHRYFQTEIPLSQTMRTSAISVDTASSPPVDIGWLLTEIELEGWELIHAGFVFHETGQVSRDKFLTSGQSTSTTGRTVGIYLFRARAR